MEVPASFLAVGVRYRFRLVVRSFFNNATVGASTHDVVRSPEPLPFADELEAPNVVSGDFPPLPPAPERLATNC